MNSINQLQQLRQRLRRRSNYNYLSSVVTVGYCLSFFYYYSVESFSIIPTQPSTFIASSWTPRCPIQQQPPIFIAARRKTQVLFATSGRKKSSSTNNDDDVDVPADWSEDDILAEFEDDGVVVPDDDDDDIEEEEDDTTVTATSDDDDPTVLAAVADEEEDEIDLDEIDLDEEDDDDDVVVEERVGNIAGYDNNNNDDWEDTYSDNAQLGDMVIPWDPDVDGIDYELQDDILDPNYMQQKERVQRDIVASQQRIVDETFDAYEYIQNTQFTPEQISDIERSEILRAVEERARGFMITEQDLDGIDDIEKEYNDTTDLMKDDPYIRHDPNERNFLQEGTGLTDDDMEAFDTAYKRSQQLVSAEPWDKVMAISMKGFDHLTNETIAEMEECLEEIGGSAYNVTNWLLYDLDYNISNLILAAVKHNPQAPILFQHWYPQLATYKRYADARERNFDFTWSDVENADITELERYYKGFGYDTIPSKAPSETGIISFEELDEEEIKMAAFEHWMIEVYNPEGDRKDFDDDTLRDEDNVFSDYYEAPQHPDLPTFDDALEDITGWNEELGEAGQSTEPDIVNYKNMMGRTFDYTVVNDPEFVKEFRGHLIIACTGYDTDLEIAEKISKRFEREFGKAVFVETRVLALAREEDNVFEIWLESYEIDLLHSKKRATSGAKGWIGPATIDDDHIEYLTKRVKFLISDDARYSYRLEREYAD